MKTNRFQVFLSIFLILISFFYYSQASSFTSVTVYSWQELTAALSKGIESIYLGNDIASDGSVLNSGSVVTIDGRGYAMINTVVDGGEFRFTDIILRGTSGTGKESGNTAIVIHGTGTTVHLSGNTSVIGGRSASDGLYGGCGVILDGDDQELELCDSATISGGTGRYRGGDAIQVKGCNAFIHIHNSASLIGAMGSNEGADALLALSCTTIKCQDQTSLAGGDGYLIGGNAIQIVQCPNDDSNGSLTVCGDSVLTGGCGHQGGCAICASNTNLYLSGCCYLFGGAGYLGGRSLLSDNCSIDFQPESMILASGASVLAGTEPFLLRDSQTSGNQDGIIRMGSSTLTQNPAESIPEIVENELRKKTASGPVLIDENESITRYALKTQHERLQLERSKLSQAKLNGSTLKIRIFNTTIEQMFSFNERFLADGNELFFILIASQSAPGYTITSSLAALRKLYQSGVTHIVYTSIPPIYCERILDLQTIINDIDSVDYAVASVHFGTADDCIIFWDENGTPDYRLELMNQSLRPVPQLQSN